MSKQIKISLQWDKESALNASKIFYDWDMRHSTKRYIGWLFVAFVQFGIVGAVKHDSFGMLYLSTVLIAYWYYGRWYLRRNMMLRYYKNFDFNNAATTFIVNRDGFKYDKEQIQWDHILKILKIEDDILVQTQSNTLYFKKDSFASYEDQQIFIEFAKEFNKL